VSRAISGTKNTKASKTKPTSKKSIKKSSGGTYYAGSGTYVSSSGQGMSTKNIPSGAKVVFTRDPSLKKSGGGSTRRPSGGGHRILPAKGATYDISSGTYTDVSGNKMSMSLENAQKKGATILFGSSGGRIKTSVGEMSQAQAQELIRKSGKNQARLSKETKSQIESFQKKEREFYGSLMKKEIEKMKRLKTLPESQKKKAYNEIYNKYNEKYQTAVGEFSRLKIEESLKKDYPEYNVLGQTTKEGVKYTLVPKAIKKEVVTEPTKIGLGFGITGNAVQTAVEEYKKLEGGLSTSIKKWWRDRIKQIEDIIKEHPELATDEIKENIRRARQNLETGKELTPLEKSILEKPITSLGELGIAGAMEPATLVVGSGLAQQPNLKENIVSVGKHIQDIGTSIKNFQAINMEVLGSGLEVTGKGIRGASTFVPETPEDVLLYASFEKALTTKEIPRIAKSLGLKGLGAYEVYTGATAKGLTEEERYGKFLTGAIAGIGTIPEDVVLARKIRYRLAGTKKTKVGKLGIQELELSTKKTKVKIGDLKSATEIIKEPLKLEFIPSQKEVFTGRIDPLKLLSEEVNFKKKPTLPKTNKIQSEILNLVKQNEDIISGSFAQKTLIKGSRDFKDLDILSKNPRRLAETIKSRLGEEVNIQRKTITDSPLGKFDVYKIYDKKGKHIADIDPLRYAEEGFAGMFKPIKVEGYNLLPPEIRLVSKTLQQARPLTKAKRAKVLKDISQLLGKKRLEKSPSLLRGYGLTKAEQKALLDEQMLLLTHGGRGIIPSFGKEITLREGEFFYTPTLLKTKIAAARKSRMGFGKEQEYASFLDLINPKEWSNIEFYPKAKQVIIEKAKLKKGEIEVPKIPSTEIEVVRKVPKGGTKLRIQERFRTILEGEPIEIAYVKKIKEPRLRKLENLREGRIKKSKTLKDEADLKNFLKGQIEKRVEKKIVRVPQIIKIKRQEGKRDLPESILREPIKSVRISDIRIPEKELPRTDIRKIGKTAEQRIPTRDIPRLPMPRIPERTPKRQPPRVQPPIRIPMKEPPETPLKIITKEKKRIIKVLKQPQSYDVYIKAPKKNKFVKVTKKPVGLQEARDTRNFFLDETTSRTGYIKPRQVKPSKLQYDIPKNYAKMTREKFRTFKQVKGVKTKLQPERVIEKGKYLIDTEGEKKQLDIFKAMAKAEKLKKSKPIGLQFA